MNINKEIKRNILLNKLKIISISISFISLFGIFIFMLNNNVKYTLSLYFSCLIFYGISMFIFDLVKNKKYEISEILLFMSASEKNKKQGIKMLISQNSVQDLLDNMENIKKVTENNDWLIENINKKEISKFLKKKEFIDYLKTIEYEKTKKYIEEQIKIMEFESKDGDYKYFIEYLEEKKLIKIEEKIKIFQI